MNSLDIYQAVHAALFETHLGPTWATRINNPEDMKSSKGAKVMAILVPAKRLMLERIQEVLDTNKENSGG